MAESLVKDKTFKVGDGWMKFLYKMETDSLGAVIQRTARTGICTPSLATQPPLPSTLGPRKEIRAPTTNGMTELAHFLPWDSSAGQSNLVWIREHTSNLRFSILNVDAYFKV